MIAKGTRFGCVPLVALTLVSCASPCTAGTAGRATSLEPALGAQGTLSFTMKVDQTYRNGLNAKSVRVGLLDVPRVARLDFQQGQAACQLRWIWLRRGRDQNLTVNTPSLPEGEYAVAFTWDTQQGLFNGYVNGTPLRLPGTKLGSWSVPRIDQVRVSEGPVLVTSVKALPRYLSESEAVKLVPEKLRGRHADLFGGKPVCRPMDIQGSRGGLVYEAALDDASDIKGWIMEGPGTVAFKDGWMEMASTEPEGRHGHIVHWCPKDLPDRFVAEWDFQAVSELGLCIVFFAAEGAKGQDIFDPALPKRNGVFRQYTRGAIRSYHISYYANTPSNQGRITSNMRKNNWFFLVANGPPGVVPGSKAVHHVRLIKDGAHVQFQVDGGVVIDFTDDGRRYGPILTDGKIGLRQMQWMVARYRNLKVWRLEGR